MDFPASSARAPFRHAWTQEQLVWRAANPVNPIFMGSHAADESLLFARTDKPGFVVEAATDIALPEGVLRRGSPLPLRLHLGLSPSGAARRGLGMAVPARLRPSPLHLIYRSLDGALPTLPAAEVQFNFLDFDAY